MMQPRGSTLAAFVLVALAFRLTPYFPHLPGVSMALFLPLLFSRVTLRRPQLEPALWR